MFVLSPLEDRFWGIDIMLVLTYKNFLIITYFPYKLNTYSCTQIIILIVNYPWQIDR